MRRLNVVLVVLVLAAGALLGWLVQRPDPDTVRPGVEEDGSYRVGSLPDSEGEDAVRAAAEALPLALTYDYRTLDKALAAATGQMTESFGAEFTTTFKATAEKLATEKQGVTQALVRAAGLVRLDGDKATTLVFIDQLLVASDAKKTDTPIKVSQNRVLVQLRLVDGDWKVDGIDPF